MDTAGRVVAATSTQAAKCVAIVVPADAELDVTGHAWACRLGFALISGRCVLLPASERRKLEQAAARAAAKNQRLADTGCEIDGKPVKGDHAEIVWKKLGCDYFIADGPHGLYVIEWYGGHDPSQGDIIVGPIDTFGFKDVCYPSEGEGRVYVDDYALGQSTAVEKYADKCR